MANPRLLSDFEGRLQQLQMWPEKLVIFDITYFMDQNANFATDLFRVLRDHIIDSTSSSSYKTSLLYLLDSVLKNLPGDIYLQLVSEHIVEMFSQVLMQMDLVDKKRMEFLLRTWERRERLSKDILGQLRGVVQKSGNIPANSEAESHSHSFLPKAKLPTFIDQVPVVLSLSEVNSLRDRVEVNEKGLAETEPEAPLVKAMSQTLHKIRTFYGQNLELLKPSLPAVLRGNKTVCFCFCFRPCFNIGMTYDLSMHV